MTLIDNLKQGLSTLYEKLIVRLIEHNSSDSAHGMAAPGRTLLRAASHADQRAALGLENHQALHVHPDGRLDRGGWQDWYARAFNFPVGNKWIAIAQFNYLFNARIEIIISSGQSEETLVIEAGQTYMANDALLTVRHQSYNTQVKAVGLTTVGHAANRFLWINVSTNTPEPLVRFKASGTGILTLSEGVAADIVANGEQPSMSTLVSFEDVYAANDQSTRSNGSMVMAAMRAGGLISHTIDNAWDYGAAASRGKTIYLATNPVIGSDSRLKTDIAEIPGAIAADIMQSLRPVTFRYRVGGREAYEEDEPFEEQVQVTEPVEVPKTTVQVIDGKAVQVTTTEMVQQPVFDEYPLVDADGKPVMQLVTPAVLDEETGEEITQAVYVQAVHREPRMTTVTKTRKVTKYREVEGKRHHAGYIAQEVKAALDAVADRWPAAADLAVWLLSDTTDADSTQMVRMEQMTPILHAAMRYQLAAA